MLAHVILWTFPNQLQLRSLFSRQRSRIGQCLRICWIHDNSKIYWNVRQKTRGFTLFTLIVRVMKQSTLFGIIYYKVCACMQVWFRVFGGVIYSVCVYHISDRCLIATQNAILILPRSHVKRLLPVCIFQTPQIISVYPGLLQES